MFPRIWYFRFVSYVCCLHPTIVVKPCLPLLQLSAMALFLYAAFGPCAVKGLVWDALGLNLVRPDTHLQLICQSCSYNKLQGTLPELCPRGFHWWVGPAVRPDVCPQSVYWVCNNPKLLGPLFVLLFVRFLLMGKAGSQIRCLPLAHCLGCHRISFCYYLPLHPRWE